MIEKHLFEIGCMVVGGLLGLVVKGLTAQIGRMEKALNHLVTKELCAAHREAMRGDINNIVDIVRSK